MFKLTLNQEEFLRKRKINVGDAYMFPRFGFNVYTDKNGLQGQYFSTNPFTKSLDKQSFLVKNVHETGLVQGNFLDNPEPFDIYLKKSELERRDLIETTLMSLFVVPYFWIYNLFNKGSEE